MALDHRQLAGQRVCCGPRAAIVFQTDEDQGTQRGAAAGTDGFTNSVIGLGDGIKHVLGVGKQYGRLLLGGRTGPRRYIGSGECRGELVQGGDAQPGGKIPRLMPTHAIGHGKHGFGHQHGVLVDGATQTDVGCPACVYLPESETHLVQHQPRAGPRCQPHRGDIAKAAHRSDFLGFKHKPVVPGQCGGGELIGEHRAGFGQ